MNSKVIHLFYLHQREYTAFHTLPHQRGTNNLNMACQVNKKKESNLSAIPKKKLMNSEEVFHEILLLQGTTAFAQLLMVQKSCRQATAFGEQLEVQKSVHTQTSFPSNSPTSCSPLFLYTKIKSNSPLPLHHLINFHSFEPSTLLPKI